MALIACQECGKEISTEALICPHCGRPNKKAQRAAIRTPVFWKLVQVAGFLMMVYGVSATIIAWPRMGMNGVVVLLGLLIWFLGRFGAWWKHD